MVNGAWMLDGATEDRMYALSLASRVYMRWELYEWIGPEGRDDESASSGSIGIGYDNRPGKLTVACKNRHASSAFV
ncbi:hypothetical protein PIB30_060941 [Stylosanthes scabra]|uniref:Uncharacterized protein n=1 Tax=Stylosanthes scabra TaxID=79078 RepID=A0ABU6VMF3_9FABA|nr:hypothetical protein [Stylosanthes scabra]